MKNVLFLFSFLAVFILKTAEVSSQSDPQQFTVLSAIIDLDASPSIPYPGNLIQEHHKGSNKAVIEKRIDGLYIDGYKVVLYRSGRQINKKTIQGHELRRELDGKPVLNAGVLDFLMDNQEFTPDEMKRGKSGEPVYVFFWGTAYRCGLGALCVRYCFWRNGKLDQDYEWYSENFSSYHPAACLVE